jgi:hypothetical protein
MNNLFSKKNAFAIIAITNLIALILYFALRKKEQYVVLLDAIVVGFQVAGNVILGIIFLVIDRVRSRQNNTEILDDDEKLYPPINVKTNFAKPFFLSALLILLIGFGLCILKNQ